jgi:hypothetical protein
MSAVTRVRKLAGIIKCMTHESEVPIEKNDHEPEDQAKDQDQACPRAFLIFELPSPRDAVRLQVKRHLCAIRFLASSMPSKTGTMAIAATRTGLL